MGKGGRLRRESGGGRLTLITTMPHRTRAPASCRYCRVQISSVRNCHAHTRWASRGRVGARARVGREGNFLSQSCRESQNPRTGPPHRHNPCGSLARQLKQVAAHDYVDGYGE